MGTRRYSDEEFRAAVRDPDVRNLADLCRALGLVPRGANYESLRRYAAELGVDLRAWLRANAEAALHPSRPERRSYSDQALTDALEDPDVTGYAQLCARLDLQPLPNTYRRLRIHARRLGRPIPSAWSVPGPRPGAPPRTVSVYPAAELRAAAVGASTLATVIRALGDVPTTSNYRKLRRSLDEHQVTLCPTPGVARPDRRRPLAELLVAGRPTTSSQLRKRLIEEGLKSHRCEGCGRRRWRGLPIPLELDHVDGVRDNNQLANLRLLCPNCHAQTPTYRGRNIGRRPTTP